MIRGFLESKALGFRVKGFRVWGVGLIFALKAVKLPEGSGFRTFQRVQGVGLWGPY